MKFIAESCNIMQCHAKSCSCIKVVPMVEGRIKSTERDRESIKNRGNIDSNLGVHFANLEW